MKICDARTIQGSDIAWGTFLMPFLSESWLVVIAVLLIVAAILALVVVAGRSDVILKMASIGRR